MIFRPFENPSLIADDKAFAIKEPEQLKILSAHSLGVMLAVSVILAVLVMA